MGICQSMPFLVWDRTWGLKSIMKNREGQFIREIFQKEINLDSEIIAAWVLEWYLLKSLQIFTASTFFLIECRINAVRFYLSWTTLSCPVCMNEACLC